MSILSSTDTNIRFVMGIDEAGRGPLAGPVVAAAAIVPLDIDGITDSKKITKEKDREDLYEAITSSPNVRWAVAVMDAPFIDQVNILQATMRAMAAVAAALALPSSSSSPVIELGELKIPIVPTLTIEQKGCYVITNNSSGNNSMSNDGKDNGIASAVAENYSALVDGNRCPPDMPCESHSIVKGDSKEYAIAAASILAKVSRDRLMRDYHLLYPHFGLSQHKGYPTAAHMQAVKTFGASPIHRRTFAPLKHMTFDKDGKIVD
jgi:ribonuclease HII